MASAATPGPWLPMRYAVTEGGELWTVTTGDGRALPHSKANARLKAAAPSMRNRLAAAHHALRSYQYGNAAADLAKAVADDIEQLLAQLPPPGA